MAAHLSADPIPAQISTTEIDRALKLCCAAQVVTFTAALLRADTRRLRIERRQWEAIRDAGRANPKYLLPCCAYCERVRTPGGEWVAMPTKLSQYLHENPKSLRLTHGFCPDCINSHFPEESANEDLGTVPR
jgi:hypothetical protein